jgi:hypothetical protein
MPLGASRLNTLSKAIISVAPPVASTYYTLEDSTYTQARMGTLRSQVSFCGFDTNDRPVFVYPYNEGSSVGKIVLFRVNSDGTITYGTPYQISGTVAYEPHVTTEYEGENRFDMTTVQDNVGYVAWQTATGYQITKVAAFYYNRDNLSVTQFGTAVSSTLTAVTTPLAYVGTRRVATSGRGGSNAKYHQVTYYTRTSGSLTMTLTASGGNQLPAGQGGLGNFFGFGNDCGYLVEISGNNGRGQQSGAHKLQGSTVYTDGSGTEFFNQYSVTRTTACPIDSTSKIMVVGYGGGRSPTFATGDARMQVIDVDYKVGTTNIPVNTNGKTYRIGGYANRFSMASGHSENELYLFVNDRFDTNGENVIKMKKVYVSATGNQITFDNNFEELDRQTSLDFGYEVGTGRSVTTPGGDEVVVFAGRQWNVNNLVIMAVQNFQSNNTGTVRTPRDVTFQGANTVLTTATKKTDQASIFFNGDNSHYATIGDTAANMMPANTAPWTVEFYFNASNVTNEQGIVGDNGNYFGIKNGKATFYHSDVGTVQGTTALATGTWYHLAVVNDGTNISLYLNGTSENTVSTPGTISWSSSNMSLGRAGPSNKPFSGYLDYVLIKSVARYSANFTVNLWLAMDDTDTVFATNPMITDYNDMSSGTQDNVNGRGYAPVQSGNYTSAYQDIP